MLETKMSWNGRWPAMEDDLKILKVEYLIGSSLNFKLNDRGQNKKEKCMRQREPSMQDALKMLKVEYYGNHWTDLSSNSKLKFRGQTNPQMEILQVVYLNNQIFLCDLWVLRGKSLENSK